MLVSAPARIDLSGGAADIFGKCTLCSAITLRAYCKIEPSDTFSIHIEGTPVSLDAVPILKAVIARANPNFTAKISVYSDIPPQSGLGGSASISVALMYGIHILSHREPNLYEIAELTQRAETDAGMLNGYQDWYAAAFGGVLFLDFQKKCNNPIDKEPYATVEDLSDYMELQVVVADSQVTHSSSLSNTLLYQKYMNGSTRIVSLIDRLDTITREAKKAVVHRDLEKLAGIIKENQEIIRKLGRSTPENELLIDAAYRGGAVACKVTGAGHGGCIAALCSGEKNYKSVKDALCEVTDAVYPVRVDKGVLRMDNGENI
jgi:D-glycero-alpha-D-manno-heptose-7-phosphate kinase